MGIKYIHLNYVFLREKFAYDLRTARAKSGLTQGDLGEMIGLTANAVCGWELDNDWLPLLSNFLAVCNLFDFDPRDYFCLEDVKNG